MLTKELHKQKITEIMGPQMKAIVSKVGLNPASAAHYVQHLIRAGILKKGKKVQNTMQYIVTGKYAIDMMTTRTIERHARAKPTVRFGDQDAANLGEHTSTPRTEEVLIYASAIVRIKCVIADALAGSSKRALVGRSRARTCVYIRVYVFDRRIR